ncbi:MAG: restriction endonuclease [Paramuribaculum sp.]|nr:restriction endonuclease [Paramuribaculum sp.]
MTPKEYEDYVGTLYAEQGYDVTVSPLSNDWGIDVIAIKGDEKIGVQAKMYGDSKRSVNRHVIMELYGAAAYQDCTKAVLATDGAVRYDARKVAEKLGIDILYTSARLERPEVIEEVTSEASHIGVKEGIPSFDEAWEKYIFPLKGTTLYNSRGSNRILSVDWGGIKRITSNGKIRSIGIEGFRLAYNELIKRGSVSRDYINQEYDKKCSSGIVLVLSQIPYIDKTEAPIGLKINKYE